MPIVRRLKLGVIQIANWTLIFKTDGKLDQPQPFQGTLDEVKTHALRQVGIQDSDTVLVFDSTSKLRASFDNPRRKPGAGANTA